MAAKGPMFGNSKYIYLFLFGAIACELAGHFVCDLAWAAGHRSPNFLWPASVVLEFLPSFVSIGAALAAARRKQALLKIRPFLLIGLAATLAGAFLGHRIWQEQIFLGHFEKYFNQPEVLRDLEVLRTNLAARIPKGEFGVIIDSKDLPTSIRQKFEGGWIAGNLYRAECPGASNCGNIVGIGDWTGILWGVHFGCTNDCPSLPIMKEPIERIVLTNGIYVFVGYRH